MKASKIVISDTCPTCCRPASAPFRSWDGDKIVSGCVDHFHGGHLVTPSASASWHGRTAAKNIRIANRKMRDGFVTEAA